jgi:GNAT superfamily N-acetyltransferase
LAVIGSASFPHAGVHRAERRYRSSSCQIVAARGLGLGAKLVAQCLQFARETGYDDITLWTYDRLAAARKVYQAAGFTLTSEYSDNAFGHQMMSQTWSRRL